MNDMKEEVKAMEEGITHIPFSVRMVFCPYCTGLEESHCCKMTIDNSHFISKKPTFEGTITTKPLRGIPSFTVCNNPVYCDQNLPQHVIDALYHENDRTCDACFNSKTREKIEESIEFRNSICDDNLCNIFF
jgi:hypothetical protein